MSEEIAQNVRGLKGANVRSTNDRIHRRIRSNVCYNFCKGISYFYVSRCVPSLHRSQYGTYTRAALPWMCAIKRRLPSHPRLMVILLGEIEGFSFPAKKSVDGLPLPPSLTLGLECAILPRSFSDPPTSRKRRRRPRELSVSPTDFSIKLRKRPARARWDPPPSPSTHPRLYRVRTRRRKGWRRRRLRGKIAFPGLYRHAGGRTVSEARSISTATIVPGDIRAARRTQGDARGWKKGRMSGRSGEKRGENVRNRGSRSEPR